jgi:hypothetical protein
MVWYDYRNGDYDIYAQRYDGSGNAMGGNFLVSDDVSGSHQRRPTAAGLAGGGFVVTWDDFRNEGYDIYAQRYDGSGNALGSNFLVNDDGGASAQYMASVAALTGGGFVVAWEDFRSGDWDIYGQRYDGSGNALGSNYLVNDDGGGNDQYEPSVAVLSSGDFVVTWEDDRYGDNDIYGQRFNSSGSALGSNFRVNDDTAVDNQYEPSVAALSGGGFVVTWEDARYVGYDIYAQRYDGSGNALGSNFVVNDDGLGNSQYEPSVAGLTAGGFAVTWYDYRLADTDIFGQRYDGTGNALGNNFRVSEDTEGGYEWAPATAALSGGGFVVAWNDPRDGNQDIYAQRYYSSGNAQGINFLVNDDEGSSTQHRPAVAAMQGGDFVVSWYDYRNGHYDIYAQLHDGSGTALGSNFLVNDDGGSSEQYAPSVGGLLGGGFVVSWEDYRNGYADIYAQRYDGSGNALGSNFLVNNDGGGNYQYEPSIAALTGGDFVVTWEDDRYGDDDIYGQRYNGSGTALGSNFLVNDDGGSNGQYAPSVAGLSGGGFVVTWYDFRNWDYDIYAQRFSGSGVVLGANFLVNDDGGSSDQDYPDVAALPDGGFLVAWDDERNGNWDVYAQFHDAAGSPVGGNFQVDDDPGDYEQYAPVSIAILGSGGFMVAWEDHRTGNADVFAQWYSIGGEAIGGNFRLSGSEDMSTQGWPDCAAAGDRVMTVWRDNRIRGQGNDIFANILELTDVSAGLVAYYPFNGNTNDESGNGNNGTVVGATLAADRFGDSNAAYEFPGSSYISVPTPSQILNTSSDQFTFQAWIKSTSGDGTTAQNVYEASTQAPSGNREIYFEANMPAPMRFGITWEPMTAARRDCTWTGCCTTPWRGRVVLRLIRGRCWVGTCREANISTG